MPSHFPFDLSGKTDLPKRPALQLTTAVDLKDIKAIIDLMKKNDLSVFEMEKDGFRLKLQKGAGEQTVFSSPTPVASAPATNGPATTAAAAPAPEASATSTLKDIVSPMVGTFYRAGSPETPAFVDVGKEVSEETVVCIIEAMKVMNEIKAEKRCRIVKITAENSRPVTVEQDLFWIEPA